jgi:hypothetical protein
MTKGPLQDVGTATSEKSSASLGHRMVGTRFTDDILQQEQQHKAVNSNKGKHSATKAANLLITVYCLKCDTGICVGNCFNIFHKIKL